MSEWATPSFRDAERRILVAMYDGVDSDFGFFPFKTIARASGVPLEMVKPLVRLLAVTGEASFMRGLMSEDGDMIGSGYGLTEEGRTRAAAIEEEQWQEACRLASCDTQPKDGDVEQAPLVSGAVTNEVRQTPKV